VFKRRHNFIDQALGNVNIGVHVDQAVNLRTSGKYQR
jgi:hypothetical protein